MVQTYWAESPSTGSTAEELLCHFQDASHARVPPLEYPIPTIMMGEQDSTLPLTMNGV